MKKVYFLKIASSVSKFYVSNIFFFIFFVFIPKKRKTLGKQGLMYAQYLDERKICFYSNNMQKRGTKMATHKRHGEMKISQKEGKKKKNFFLKKEAAGKLGSIKIYLVIEVKW